LTNPTNRSSRRIERRNEREARQPGANAPRPRRQRAPAAQRRSTGRSFSLLPIAIVLGVVAVAAVLIYAVASANNKSSTTSDWITAELDARPACPPEGPVTNACLPGEYIKPHPGFDGFFDPTNPASDDRKHVATGVDIPICSDDLIAADTAVTDVYADRSNVADCYTSNPPVSGPHADQPAQFKVWDNEAPKENLLHSMEHGAVVVWYNTDNQDVIDQLAKIVNDNLNQRKLMVMSRYEGLEPDTIAVTSWTRLDKFAVSDFTKKRVQNFIDANERRFNPEGF
jgi:Protein of unknown function (DUF3105)